MPRTIQDSVAGHEYDARRPKDDLLGMMAEDAIKIALIPGGDPLLSECLRVFSKAIVSSPFAGTPGAFVAMSKTLSKVRFFIDAGCKRPHQPTMDSSHHARRIRRARRLSAGAWDMRAH